MSETLGLKNVNMLSRERYDGIEEPATDELYAISGSGFGFPGNRYDDLQLGASGTTYKAPASGYLMLSKDVASTNQYIRIDNETSGLRLTVHVPGSSATARGYIPARKDDILMVKYTASGSTGEFRFIYAEGE